MEIQLTEELGQTRIQVRQGQINNVGPAAVSITILILFGLGWLAHYFYGQYVISHHKNYLSFLAVAALFFLGLFYALYDIACRYFNIIEIILHEKGEFIMRQYPIPRPGLGPIPRAKIRQFYIKRHLNQADSRKVEHLSLCLRLKNGITKSLLFDKASNYSALRELETMFEERLGIVEAPAKGEFRPGVLAKSKTPRPVAQSFSGKVNTSSFTPNKQTIQVGDLEWDVLFQKQYDWTDHQTDKLLTIGFGGERKHLYLEASGQSFELRHLGLARQLELGLNVQEGEIHFDSQQLRLLRRKSGQVFRALQQHQPGIACRQYILMGKPDWGRIRVVHFQDMLEVYQETALEESPYG